MSLDTSFNNYGCQQSRLLPTANRDQRPSQYLHVMFTPRTKVIMCRDDRIVPEPNGHQRIININTPPAPNTIAHHHKITTANTYQPNVTVYLTAVTVAVAVLLFNTCTAVRTKQRGVTEPSINEAEARQALSKAKTDKSKPAANKQTSSKIAFHQQANKPASQQSNKPASKRPSNQQYQQARETNKPKKQTSQPPITLERNPRKPARKLAGKLAASQQASPQASQQASNQADRPDGNATRQARSKQTSSAHSLQSCS